MKKILLFILLLIMPLSVKAETLDSSDIYITMIIIVVLVALIFLSIVYFGKLSFGAFGYGYQNNKEIPLGDVPNYSGIPCNMDIYYANMLIVLNKFVYKESSLFSAIMFKLLKEHKIRLKHFVDNDFYVIELKTDSIFDNEVEKDLFYMMLEASDDGVLEIKMFERWCKRNYSMFLKLFSKIENIYISKYRDNGMIYVRKHRKECKFDNVMSLELYEDSVKLYGLKKYLQEFSNVDTKEVIDVNLIDEYLMFAFLFGLADKMIMKLKNISLLDDYKILDNDVDLDSLLFINDMSVRIVEIACFCRNESR